MGTTSSAAKRRYNKSAYRVYESYVGIDSLLNALIERHKERGGSVSGLIKKALCEHWGITPGEGDVIYTPYHIDGKGNRVTNDLEKYIERG